MTSIILTKYDGAFLGPVAKVLGMLMNGIYFVLEKIGIPNVGLSIILFTIIIYLLMLPLTIKQQKFSKLSNKMNPELQAINQKYKGKKDNDSMMRMNEETKAVYAKYGSSPTGSCLPMLVQMPILLALYRVINGMPAYVTSIKNVYTDLVVKLSNTTGAAKFLESFKNVSYYSKQFKSEEFVTGSEYMQNTFIDVLNKASTTEWEDLAAKFPDLSSEIVNVSEQVSKINNFLGLNIGNSPSHSVKEAWSTGNYFIVVGALMIPLLAALTQFINTKLMPQAPQTGDQEKNPMMASMKTMNYTMPIFSAFMCFGLPAGMGIYWISGAVVRSVQQILINKHIDKIDIDTIIEKNKEKLDEKNKPSAKNAVTGSSLNDKARKSTKNIEYNSTFESGNETNSMASKANKVKHYNERNNI